MTLTNIIGVHIALNRRWYSAIFRGKYNPYRIMQTVINCGILLCTIFLMISGIILSNQLFTFLNIQGGLGFARIAHLLASHWYYLFMSLHIGLHVGVITNKMRHSAPINCHPKLVSGSSTNEMPKQDVMIYISEKWYSDLTESESRRKVQPNSEEGTC